MRRRIALATSVCGAAAAAATLRDGTAVLPWSTGPRTALVPNQSLFCPLQAREWVTPDTVRLRFELPTPSHVLGLPVPGHLVAIDNAMIYRPYSPVTIDALATGYFDLLVKRYPGGEISSYLAHLEPGERVHFRGPIVNRYEYHRGAAKRLGLVAGGTGITPMWQVIQSVLADEEDTASISLVYACRSADAIPLKREIDEAAARHPQRLSVRYVVSDAAASGTAAPDVQQARIDASLLQQLMPAADAEGCQLLVSGPEGMVRALCGARARDGGASGAGGAGVVSAPLGGVLKQLGYREEQVAWL